MKRSLTLGFLLLGGFGSLAHADATLVYEITDANAGKVEKTFSIARFFARVDSSGDEGEHLLYQAGKFFPLYRVSEKDRTYSRLTPPVDAWLGPKSKARSPEAKSPASAGEDQAQESTAADSAPETLSGGPEVEPKEAKQEPAAAAGQPPAAIGEGVPGQGAAEEKPASAQAPRLNKLPQFRATRKTDKVSSIGCRVVLELVDGEPAVEHCMANKAALGITEREMRTLARLFVMARERAYDWLGASTQDEDFVSVRSRDLARGKTLMLQSVSTKALPVGHLRIPRDFKEVKVESAMGGGAKAAGADVAPVTAKTDKSDEAGTSAQE
jgi:hypothetical protein